MDITPLGHSSYRIKGKNAILVTDPFDGLFVGFPFPKHVAANIVTVSHDHSDHNATDQIEGEPYILKGAGEYDIKGVPIIGVSTHHDTDKGEKRGNNIVYRMEVDNINIVHLGDLGRMLTKEEVELLDGVDILFVPVGGQFTISVQQAMQIIGEFEPMIVIPMHYKTAKHNQKEFGTLSPVSEFLKLMGKEDVVPVPKLSTTKDKLPVVMQVVVLE